MKTRAKPGAWSPEQEIELEKLLPGFELRFGKVQRKVLKSKPAKLIVSAESMFAQAWERERHPANMVREHQFHPERKWRFDFAWPVHKLALELDGQGRHQRVLGEREDMVKGREAVRLGWRVLHWQSMQVAKELPSMIQFIKEVLSDGTR